MRPTIFSTTSPGRVVPIGEASGGAFAFVPDPLPRDLPLTYDLVSAYGAAERSVSRLEEALPRRHFDPYLLIYPLLYREAYYSSRMEGTFTTPQEMVLFDVGNGGTRSEQTREVLNYVRAAEAGLELVREAHLPICHRVIRETHRRLLQGVRGSDKQPGEWRTSQNYIGHPARDTIATARFVPPPPAEVQALMDDLESYINLSDEAARTPLLIRLALIHYQFETIHPFRDGNGRIGRLLIPLLLCEKGWLREPTLHVSPTLIHHDEDYRHLMFRVSTHGEWAPWVIFFLGVLRDSADATLGKTTELWEMREDYLRRVTTKQSSPLLHKLVNLIMQRGRVTFNQAASHLDVTHPQAAKHVRRLQRLGILEEVSGRKRNLVFVAKEVLDCVFKA